LRGGRRREGKDRTQSSEILRNDLTGKILFIKKSQITSTSEDFSPSLTFWIRNRNHAIRNPLVVDKEELTKCIIIFRKTVPQFTKGDKKIACEKSSISSIQRRHNRVSPFFSNIDGTVRYGYLTTNYHHGFCYLCPPSVLFNNTRTHSSQASGHNIKLIGGNNSSVARDLGRKTKIKTT
jgi:hypothetical protein